MWNDVIRHIRDNDRFLVTTHIHPDGDAIGSEIALAAYLRNLGKQVAVVNSSVTPQSMSFLDGGREIQIFSDNVDREQLAQTDVVFILDVNNWNHLGPFGDVLKGLEAPRICIDHHEGLDDGFAEVHVGDTTAAATGVLIYELIMAMGGEVTRPIADALFATLSTDTGSFRFTNTDERAFRVAADLCHHGVDPFAIHRAVFSKTEAAVRLLGAALGTMDTAADGRVAWIWCSQKMFREASADYEDSDGLLDIVRTISSVEYCLFFKELANGRVKISLRSNGKVDVHRIAKHFGGGGHRMASGVTVDGPLERAIHNVIQVCIDRFPLP